MTDLTGRFRPRIDIAIRKLLVYAVALALIIAAEPAPYPFSVGCVIVTAGLALRLWAFGHLAKNRELTTAGPYGFTRNPGYLGTALVGSGLFLAAGNSFSVAGIAIWLAGMLGIGWFAFKYLPRKYRIEYTRLESEFGAAAREYAAHVPDFWPRATPWSGRARDSFAWPRVMDNHEWPWAPLCALALGLMWLG